VQRCFMRASSIGLNHPQAPPARTSPRPLDQLRIADRLPSLRAVRIRLPVRPGSPGLHVIDQLVKVGRHAHLVGADRGRAPLEHRPGDHEHITLGPRRIHLSTFYGLSWSECSNPDDGACVA